MKTGGPESGWTDAASPAKETMAKTKSKTKIIIFSIVAAVGIGVAVYASLKKSDPPVTVETERVARRNLIEKVVANGKIEPVIQVKISPEVSGEIIELGVKEGQQVKKGDLLVKIKPDNYLAASNSAAASTIWPLPTRARRRRTWRRRAWNTSGVPAFIRPSWFPTRTFSRPRPPTTLPNHGGRRGGIGGPWPRPPCKPPPPTFPKPPFIPPWTARSANSIPNWRTGRRHGDDGRHGDHEPSRI